MQTMESAIIAHRQHGHKQFFVVWGGLLLITAVEVFLAYQHLQPLRMLTILLGLSIIKAALIISYFMHLKFEARRMRILLMGALVACLCLMSTFFPDAFRILSLGVK
ncbi:MAG: cytochrome C oxidase subunit IV family protein [Terriglobales bacterium]